MATIERSEQILKADLVSLQDYLERRHGPAIAQLLIDDMVTREQVFAKAA